MYNKEEATFIKQKFWTAFGKYMQPVPSASGEKVNWINYKTGIKGIYVRMNADNDNAYVAIEFSLGDKELQLKYFNCFLGLKKHFYNIAGVNWNFNKNYTTNDGKSLSIVITQLNGIKIFRESDWPAIISFLKKNMIALDLFWNDFKPAFEI